MSLACFQSLLARLVTDAVFREQARNDGHAFSDEQLTPRERDRLRRIVDDRGIDLTATLISSFRLGKMLSLLPLTRVVLGDRRLAREAKRFWVLHPPTSFYALDEVIAFCDYLSARRREGLRVPYLSDVLALERAVLELRRPGGRATVQHVRIRYDASQLLPPLTAGRRPHRVGVRRCALVATLDTDGLVRWDVSPQH